MQKAVDLAPQDAGYRYNLGRVLAARSMFAEALPQFSEGGAHHLSCWKPSIDSMPASLPDPKSTRASSSRLLDGVSSTAVEKRSPFSPKVPAWPVAMIRAFSFGLAPEPSESTMSGPSSSQRSKGRLAAERSVHAQSSFCALPERGSAGSH